MYLIWLAHNHALSAGQRLHSNSFEEICDVKLADYVAKKKTGTSPSIQFCHMVRGAILNSPLELSDNDTSGEPSSTYDAKIISKSEWFWLLTNHCNINHRRADETGDYNRIVLKGFKALTKYIQRKAIDFGALINLPAGWVRAPGHRFTSDDEAGAWFNGKIKEYSSGSNKTPLVPRPAKPVNKPSNTGLSFSCWSSNKSDALPDPSQLSLDDGVDFPSIVHELQRKNRGGRRNRKLVRGSLRTLYQIVLLTDLPRGGEEII
ncbi:hypothetical protein CEP54_015556 [Fusarium duplospermum]|uniref:Uncharacterized protein n=1 Tax=Fusarium duplospermum TaxID=1325734 RepID=A0A428NN33_9HYPO|nr:hypothetical protein CEP54_015556 [Fusarium duplospermum]